MNYKRLLPKIALVIGYLLLWQCAEAQNNDFTFSGSGVLHYNDEMSNVNAPANPGKFDLHSIVFKAGYDFNSKLSVKTKLKIEHLFWGPSEGEVVFLDQAYVDYKLNPNFGVRAGIYSTPLGGSKFKPSHGLESAPTDKYISYGWRELTVGVFGYFNSRFTYEAYLMSGLHVDEISVKSGIFNARKSKFSSSINNLAASARLAYQLSPEISLGTSAMISDLQSKSDFDERLQGASYKIIEGHAAYRYRGFRCRLVGVYSTIAESEKINSELGRKLGSSQYGALVEFGYDIFQLRHNPVTQQLVLYTRSEVYDTHLSTVSVVDMPEYERYEYTFGAVFKPLRNFEIEADYQLLHSGGDKNIQMLNVGVGYLF